MTDGGPDMSLNMGSFEMERMLRLNAHEKAFEIKVLAQRAFETEKEKIVFEGRKQQKADQDERINKLNQELNIARSKKINASRLKKMEERNTCLLEIKEMMKGKLREQMKNDRPTYLKTVKDLILQGMIKLIEPALQIKCREEDVQDIKGMTGELEESYATFMKDTTKRDEYTCELTVLDDNFLGEDKDQGCGGIILYTADSRIVCPNTIINRLYLSFEELLPQIRKTLFPAPAK